MINSTYNSLNYRMFGNGRPVLFLHGFLESISMWHYLNLKELNCCCIVVDIPGHGESELVNNANEDPSIQFFAQKIQQLLVYLKIEECVVVGHSMGGYIGLELMLINPKVEKLMLLNSNFWNDSDAKKKDRVVVAELVWKQKSLFLKTAIPNLFFEPKSHERDIQLIIDEAEKIAPLGIAYASLAMRNRSDFTQYITSFPEKIWVLQGENDPIVQVGVMQDVLPNNVIVRYLEDCGHMSHIEQTANVLEYLSKFIE